MPAKRLIPAGAFRLIAALSMASSVLVGSNVVTTIPAQAATGSFCSTQTTAYGERVTGCLTGTAYGLHITYTGYTDTAGWPNGIGSDVAIVDANANRDYSAGWVCYPPDFTVDVSLQHSSEYIGSFVINLRSTDYRVNYDVMAGGQGTTPPTSDGYIPTPCTSQGPKPPQPPSCSGPLPFGTVVGMADTADGKGYWIASSTGQVAACGDAPALGNGTNGTAAIAAAPSGNGYWLVSQVGQVKAFGSAVNHGGLPTGTALGKPIVAMASDPATGGYWLLGGDGGVFSFDAPFYGSTGNIRLNKPAVGMAATPTGNGYYFVASDGGIFAFGKAPFYGSTGNIALAKPVVGMAIDPATGGYWMDASDGGIFAFHAPFYGSTGNVTLAQPCVGLTAMPDGSGYRFVAADGGIFDFHAPFEGSAAA